MFRVDVKLPKVKLPIPILGYEEVWSSLWYNGIGSCWGLGFDYEFLHLFELYDLLLSKWLL